MTPQPHRRATVRRCPQPRRRGAETAGTLVCSLRRLFSPVLAIAAVIATGVLAHAEDLPRTSFKVVGGWSQAKLYTDVERPFWTREVTEHSNGAITAELTPFNDMNVRGSELVRQLRLGAVDIASVVLGTVAGDDARNEALDLVGIAPDFATLRKLADAYRPVYDKFYRANAGVRVLGLWTYAAQMLYCARPFQSLADLRGLKVRVAGRLQTEFVESLGANALMLPSHEIVPAMRNGELDCAITGALSGNMIGLTEVATHLYALPLSWSLVLHGASLKTWERLDPKVRAFLEKEFAALEERSRDAAAFETEQGIACNIGREDCQLGIKGKMKLVQASESDRDFLNKLLADILVPRWAARCPTECVPDWNRTVGAVIGITAPIN